MRLTVGSPLAALRRRAWTGTIGDGLFCLGARSPAEKDAFCVELPDLGDSCRIRGARRWFRRTEGRRGRETDGWTAVLRRAGAAPITRHASYCMRALTERCRSGRSGRSRKPLYPQGYRGFESHPLRQTHLPVRPNTSQSYRYSNHLCLIGIPPYPHVSRGIPRKVG
jgi:hypothetical protein